MESWQRPDVPKLPGAGKPPSLFDAVQRKVASPPISNNTANLYVCGITPYDATHLGHAFTYLAFDTLQRAWLDAGIRTRYVQNITDVDDPLLERAAQTHVDWRELADSQISLFREDMHALDMLPPDEYVAVTESIDLIVQAVQSLQDLELAYPVPTPDSDRDDIYFDVNAASARTPWQNGSISGLSEAEMRQLCEERGGDPDRVGKRSPLDPMLWRAARVNEPSWETAIGRGRPGWHIECSAIAVNRLGMNFTVQGGGADLLFPHHEYSAAHATAQTGHPLAKVFAHAGLVAYDGEKMSKSKGNLVFVSQLLADGLEPTALRLALLNHHYRTEWEWRDEMAETATDTLERWRRMLHVSETQIRSEESLSSSQQSDEQLLHALRNHLCNDLDTPSMLAALDGAITAGFAHPQLVRDAASALLGLRL